MLKRFIAVSAIAASCLASISQGQTVIGGPIVSPVHGHTYYILSNSNWSNAQQAALTLKGNLATVRSSAEENWIEHTFGAYPYLWLGLYDPIQQDYGSSHASNFVWADGETTTYRNWASGEPNDFNGEEYFTELVLTTSSTDASGTWNDIYNDANPTHTPNSYGPVYGLAEVVPEPTAVGLSAIIATSLLCKRARRHISAGS